MADVTRYTTVEMVAAARAEGLPATVRQVRDWVQLGLLDAPVKVGLGRGVGSRATYPYRQFQIYLELLRGRAHGSRIDRLANFPVWVWLRWGDQDVPLRQVRRALATWARAATNPGVAAAESAARDVAALVATPGARRGVKRGFRQVLVDQQLRGGVNRTELFEPARELIGTSGRGPSGARLDAGKYLDVLEARRIGILRIGLAADEEFEKARAVYRIETARYRNDQPAFAADPEIGRLFEERTATEEMNSACIDLVVFLGFEFISRSRRGDSNP